MNKKEMTIVGITAIATLILANRLRKLPVVSKLPEA